jgi:O-antigen/teichoic acid export membrane protein
MSRTRHIFRQTTSNALAAAVGFLLSAVLARSLDTNSFGKINFLMAICAMLTAICEFGFSTASVVTQNRFKSQCALSAECVYAANRTYLRLYPLLLFSAGTVLAVLSTVYDLTRPELAVIFVCIAAASMYRYLNSIHQALGEWRRYSLMIMASPFLKCALVLLCLSLAYFQFTPLSLYESVLSGYVLHALLIIACGLWWTRKHLIVLPFPAQEISQHFYQVLVPIGLTGLLAAASMRLDSIIIKHYLGNQQLAIYAVAVTVAMGFPLVTGSILDIVLKQAAEEKLSYIRNVFRQQRRLLVISIALFAACELFSEPLVTWVFSGRYAASVPILRWLLVPYFWGMFFTPLESYFVAHEPRRILIMNCLQLLIVVIGSMALIPCWGLLAVVWSLLLSRVVRWTYFAVRARLLLAAHPEGV